MRSGGIPCPRQTWRLRCTCYSCVRTCIIGGEQTLAARLTCHAHECDKIVSRSAGDTTFGHATVTVAIKHAAFVVDGDFVEVEKVAVQMAATLLPDARHALHRIIRGGVTRRPSHAAVVGGGYERVPFTGETYRLVVARDIGAQEANGRAAGASADRLDFGGILDAV